MRSMFERPGFISFLAILLAGAYSPVHAAGFVCSQINLKGASGVIGMEHRYAFSAVCSWSSKSTKTEVGITGVTSTTKNYGITMEVLGEGRWDRKTGKTSEALKIKGHGATHEGSGDFTGTREFVGNCNQDPFLKDPPGASAVCKPEGLDYKSKSGPEFGKLLDPPTPIMMRVVSLAEAQALSAKKASNTPPPPPPKPQPKKEPLKIGDARGAPGGAKAAPGAAAALARPNLSVVASRANIEPNCQTLKPAMTVKVTIRNSGGPLPADRGVVFVKESGGANLSSGGVFVPKLDPGEEKTVSIPAVSPHPYSNLPGKHKLQVLFTPSNVGGKPAFGHPATPFVVEAEFPPDHCKTASRQPPGSAGNAPQPHGIPPAPPAGAPKR